MSSAARLCLAVVAVATTLTACMGGRPSSADDAATTALRTYLDALRSDNCAAAFGMGKVDRDWDLDHAVLLLDEPAFANVCTHHKLKNFTFSKYDKAVFRDADERTFLAKLEYEDRNAEVVLWTQGDVVLHAVERMTLQPRAGPVLDLRIDGFPVSGKAVTGCPPGCVVDDLDIVAFRGPHTLTAAASPWTEAISAPLPEPCKECASRDRHAILPVLTPTAGAAARRAAEGCLGSDVGCPSSPCASGGRSVRARSVTATGDVVPQNNGVFDMPLGWRVEVPARVTCADGPRNKTFVVVLPLRGPPGVAMVLDAR